MSVHAPNMHRPFTKKAFSVTLPPMKAALSAYSTDDCIAALATPWGRSALAVIRTSGPGAVELLAPAFSRPRKLRDAAGGGMIHGFLMDPASGEKVDEVVLGVFRGPKSYTGEDSVEIFCHGSPPGIDGILGLLRGLGFRPAEPGEFTFRAFFHGRMDLTRAEAVTEIVAAETRKAHSLALHRLAGTLAARIDEAKALLIRARAAVEIGLDYPEGEAPEVPLPLEETARAAEVLRRLLATYREGLLHRDGARVALAGRTNAGKSSLFNLFLREERSIVSEEPGTTRDYIESRLDLGGVPVLLYDTAGLRDSSDPAETEGVRRARTLIDGAALVVYLVDAAFGETREDREALDDLGPRALAVWNKIDLAPGPAPEGRLRLSTRTGEGFPELAAEILRRLRGGEAPAGDEPVIDSARQKTLLERGLRALERFQARAGRLPLDVVGEDLAEALRVLGEITGETTSDEVLAQMFSRFCLGK